MFETSLNTNFISEKVAKIRFCPEQYSDSSSFITGSYGLQKNTIKHWRLFQNEFSEDENEYVPKCTDTISLTSDTTGLEFLDYNNVIVSSSDGKLSLIYINRDRDENNLKESFKQESLHQISCSGLSVFDEDIATIGENGAWHVFSSSAQRIIRSNNSGSLALTCVAFINRKELVVGNNLGVLKVFDTLQESTKPTNTLMVSCEDEKKCNRVTSLCYHPTQQHILLAGTEEGSITVFDLRKSDIPSSYLSAHTEPINEIAFHKMEPSKLFSCSENGDLWLWTQNTFPSLGIAGMADTSEVPWLNGERAKSSITVTSLVEGNGLAINSFDSFRNKVVAAGDNEAVYLVDHMY